MRPELSPLPLRMATLPLDERGYPVPWFVQWIDGKPEFRVMDAGKLVRAVKEKRCWVCGDLLGVNKVFVVGPMCGISRTSSEPPSHLGCALWSVANCPFLSRPHMIRRSTDDLTDKTGEPIVASGIPILRNPGVTLTWLCDRYKPWNPAPNELLFEMGEPQAIEFWKEGRRATRDEIRESIESGYPLLQKNCENDDDREDLSKRLIVFNRLVDLYHASS